MDIRDDCLKFSNIADKVGKEAGWPAIFNGVNGMKRSFRQIITAAVKPIQTVLRRFFRSPLKITTRPNTKEQQMLIDYFERRISLSDDLVDILIGMYSVEDLTCVRIVVKYMLQGNPRVITLFLRALKSNETNIRLIEGLSSACVVENVQFSLREVVAAYTKACELEQDMNRFEECVGFFYNTLKSKDFDALLALKKNPNLSREKQDRIDRRLVYRNGNPDDPYNLKSEQE